MTSTVTSLSVIVLSRKQAAPGFNIVLAVPLITTVVTVRAAVTANVARDTFNVSRAFEIFRKTAPLVGFVILSLSNDEVVVVAARLVFPQGLTVRLPVTRPSAGDGVEIPALKPPGHTVGVPVERRVFVQGCFQGAFGTCRCYGNGYEKRGY